MRLYTRNGSRFVPITADQLVRALTEAASRRSDIRRTILARLQRFEAKAREVEARRINGPGRGRP